MKSRRYAPTQDRHLARPETWKSFNLTASTKFLDASSSLLFRAIRQGLHPDGSMDGQDLVSFILGTCVSFFLCGHDNTVF
jgi:hypothetical protein